MSPFFLSLFLSLFFLASSLFSFVCLFVLIDDLKQGPSTLAQLQGLIKRDPESYEDEFEQQYEHYK